MEENRWWERETPVEVETEFGGVRYYREAQKLQINRPEWTDANGETRRGKSVTFPIFRFIGNDDLINLLKMVITAIEGDK